MTRQILWFAVAALAFGVGAAAVQAEISIAPAFVEVTLDKGRPAGRFEIANLGDQEERYRVNALHFNFSRDGSLMRQEPDDHSLVSWIRFNPTEVTVPAKSSRIVRFVILPKANLAPGEYWAAMELENLKTQTGKTTDSSGRELKIEVVTTIMVPIFGKAGNVRYDGAIDAFKAAPDDKGTLLEAMVTNKGDGRLLIRGEYEIFSAAGEPVAKDQLGYAYIMPGTDRLFANYVKVPLPAGEYKLRVQYRSPQLSEPIARETTLTLASPSVPPVPKTEEKKPEPVGDKPAASGVPAATPAPATVSKAP